MVGALKVVLKSVAVLVAGVILAFVLIVVISITFGAGLGDPGPYR